MYTTCIFDMDGTVADTLSTISYYGNNALKKYGYPEIEREVYKILVGDGYMKLIKNMLDYVASENYTNEQYEEIAEYFKTTYDADFLYLTVPYDGILDMMKALKEKGIKIGILTNKHQETAVQVSDALFGDLVDVIVGDCPDKPLKPDRRAIEYILEKMNVTADEIIYLGDTGTDMKTGKIIDAFTIGVTWGFRGIDELNENGADAIINHPMEILEYLK